MSEIDNDALLLLARIDEKIKNIEKQIARSERELHELRTKLNVEINNLEKVLRDNYLTKEHFLPYQRAVITVITTVIAGIVMAVVNIFIKR